MRSADGSYGEVESLVVVQQSQPMYNVSVAGAHTYFVGDGAWLVHNSCDLGRWARKMKLNPNSETTQQLYRYRSVTVQQYISKFRAGSINGVVPEKALSMTVEVALRRGRVDNVNIRKLLTDLRDKFRK